MGRLQFAALVDPVGKALLKSVNWFLRPLARLGKRDRLLPFPKPLGPALRRWLRPGVLAASIPFRPPPPSWDVFTDASLQGWGVRTASGLSLRGTWSQTLAKCHINILELVAIYIALRRLPIPRHVHIRIHSDNLTAVNCLNRLGSARLRPLNSWVLSILHLVSAREWAVSVFHIAGVRNVVADSLSRIAPVSMEWSLGRQS